MLFVGSISREKLWDEYFKKFRVVVIPRPRQNNSLDSYTSYQIGGVAGGAGKPVIAMDIDVMREIPYNAILLVRHPEP